MREIRLSDHAITRFHERVRPSLPRRQAKRELDRLIAVAAEPVAEVPFCTSKKADAWLVLCDGVALPLAQTGKGYVAVTCIVAGTLSARERRRRNMRRRSRRHRRRMEKRTERHQARPDVEAA